MMNNNTAMAEGEYTKAKTSVWWDIENCQVPRGCDANGIAQKLSSELMKMNYCGPLSITSYGNTDLIPDSVQQALSSTGISLNHVPSGRKDASDKKILVDMFLWVLDNPAPANLMLISGDGDFSYALHRLRMLGYNIILAHTPTAPAPLVASANTSWLWRSLVSSGGCTLSHSESETSGEDVLVRRRPPRDSWSSSSKFTGNKRKASNQLKRIYVPKVCNVSCKVQDNDLESMKCLEKQNMELMETGTTSERSGRESWIDLESDDAAPLNVDLTWELESISDQNLDVNLPESESSLEKVSEAKDRPRDSLEELKYQPTEVEASIKEVCQSTKEVVESESKHAETVKSFGISLKDTSKKTPVKTLERERKKKGGNPLSQSRVFDVCNVMCTSQKTFDSHLKGQKHIALVKKQAGTKWAFSRPFYPNHAL